MKCIIKNWRGGKFIFKKYKKEFIKIIGKKLWIKINFKLNKR